MDRNEIRLRIGDEIVQLVARAEVTTFIDPESHVSMVLPDTRGLHARPFVRNVTRAQVSPLLQFEEIVANYQWMQR